MDLDALNGTCPSQRQSGGRSCLWRLVSEVRGWIRPRMVVTQWVQLSVCREKTSGGGDPPDALLGGGRHRQLLVEHTWVGGGSAGPWRGSGEGWG